MGLDVLQDRVGVRRLDVPARDALTEKESLFHSCGFWMSSFRELPRS